MTPQLGSVGNKADLFDPLDEECSHNTKFISILASKIRGSKRMPPRNLVIEPIVGMSYMVRNRRNDSHAAVILAKRTDTDSSRRGGKNEYLVHFRGTNRRLDKWVSAECVLAPLINPSPNRPIRHSPSGGPVKSPSRLCPGGRKTPASPRPPRGRRSTALMAPIDEVGEEQSEEVKKALLSERYDVQYEQLEKELQGDPLHALDDKYLEGEIMHMENTRIKQVDHIQFGQWKIPCWYWSQIPEPFGNRSFLFFCEYCLSYMKREVSYCEHLGVCKHTHPPGKVIYHKDAVVVYLVDGEEQVLYCTRLCLMAKLFLDHKTVLFVPNTFHFMIVTLRDERGDHFVGYFSRERDSVLYNVACLLVIPPYQQCGFGKFIISLSYELSKMDGFLGTPERPLSDLGLRSYRSFWRWRVLVDLCAVARSGETIAVADICSRTGIALLDVRQTLDSLGVFDVREEDERYAIERVESVFEMLEKCKRPALLCHSERLTYPPA